MNTLDDLQAALQYHCNNPQRGNCEACGLRPDCQLDLNDLLARVQAATAQLPSAGRLAAELPGIAADCGKQRPFEITTRLMQAIAAGPAA